MKDKYKESIYNLVHLSKAKMTFDGVYIDIKQLDQDINVLWELYNKYQELVNKTNPIFEEIKKEWEELGYECIYEDENCLEFNHKRCLNKIHFSKENEWYGSDDERILQIDIKEHQLITKTMKSLGWK